MDRLDDWRSSAFEHEASCRTSLRQSLCLGGNSWALSDHEAATILDECFRRLGLKRPSWAEGQPGYVAPRNLCIKCGCEMEESDIVKFRFCSDDCASGFMTAAKRLERIPDIWLYRRAWKEVRHRRAPERACLQCGMMFRDNNPATKYCSSNCVKAAITTRPMIKCVVCDTEFRQQKESHKCCSLKCHGVNEAREFRKSAPEICCAICKAIFRAGGRKSMYCSRRCAKAADYQRIKARKEPKQMRPCECCGEQFTPRDDRMAFCSTACRRKAEYASAKEHFVPKSKERQCAICNSTFIRNGMRDMFCGDACKLLHRRLTYNRPQRENVIALTAEIFDSWFKAAA